MRPERTLLLALTLLALALLACGPRATAAPLQPLVEQRYCAAQPARTADGRIKRRADVLAAFRRAHPCPATGRTAGPCPGWALDHVIPLACGGCDAVSNLQWLPLAIKSAAGTAPKDRWEMRVYCASPARPGAPA